MEAENGSQPSQRKGKRRQKKKKKKQKERPGEQPLADGMVYDTEPSSPPRARTTSPKTAPSTPYAPSAFRFPNGSTLSVPAFVLERRVKLHHQHHQHHQHHPSYTHHELERGLEQVELGTKA